MAILIFAQLKAADSLQISADQSSNWYDVAYSFSLVELEKSSLCSSVLYQFLSELEKNGLCSSVFW